MTDDGEYVILNGAIFDEDKDYTLEELQAIVDSTNLYTSKVGHGVGIIIGHTPDENNGVELPRVGFLENLRLGMQNGKHTILATFKLFRRFVDSLLGPVGEVYPDRSVELWEDNIISAVALLGGSRPAKELGTLFKKSGRLYRYSKNTFSEDSMSDVMNTQSEAFAAFFDLFKQTKEGAYLCKLVEEATSPVVDEPEADTTGDDLVPPEADTDKVSNDETTPEEKEDFDEGSAPSGGNTFVPGTEDKDEEEESKLSKLRMQNDDLKFKFSKLQMTLKEKELEIYSLQRKYNSSVRERELIRLQHEGYSFDLADEVEAVSELSDEHYARYLDKIKRNYKRAPIGIKFDNQMPIDVTGQRPSLSKEEYEKILKYQHEKQIPWEVALKEHGK